MRRLKMRLPMSLGAAITIALSAAFGFWCSHELVRGSVLPPSCGANLVPAALPSDSVMPSLGDQAAHPPSVGVPTAQAPQVGPTSAQTRLPDSGTRPHQGVALGDPSGHSLVPLGSPLRPDKACRSS